MKTTDMFTSECIAIQYVLGGWTMLLLWGMDISSRLDQVISFPVKLVICLFLLLFNVASGFGRLEMRRRFSGGFYRVLLHLVNAAALIGYLMVMMITYEPDPTVEAVVAAHDLPAGHVLTESDLEIRTFVKTAIWEDMIIDPEELVGKSLCTDIEQGMLFDSTDMPMLVNLEKGIIRLPIECAISFWIAGTYGHT